MKRSLAALCLCSLFVGLVGCSPKPATSGLVSQPGVVSGKPPVREEDSRWNRRIPARAARTALGSRVRQPASRWGSAATGSGSTTAGAGGPTRPSAYVPGRLDIKQRTLKAGDAGIDQRLLENPDRGLRLETRLSVDGATPNSQPNAIDDLRDQRDFYLEDSPSWPRRTFI